jgi:hypothetical protein
VGGKGDERALRKPKTRSEKSTPSSIRLAQGKLIVCMLTTSPSADNTRHLPQSGESFRPIVLGAGWQIVFIGFYGLTGPCRGPSQQMGFSCVASSSCAPFAEIFSSAKSR